MTRSPSTLTELARLGFSELSEARDALEEFESLLDAFSLAADPDRALRQLVRLHEQHPDALRPVLDDSTWAARLVRVLGASEGLAEFLRRRPDDAAPELDAIADSAIRLVREEANSDRLEPVKLDDLVREVADELAHLGYRVSTGRIASLSIRSGPTALKRVLRNLLINAATHGGGATVDLAREGDQAVLTVRDEGPGIPEDLIGQVLEPFFRVDPARRKMLPGAGLGLAIAREIIERFGGTLSISNRMPNGLIQTVRLPRASS